MEPVQGEPNERAGWNAQRRATGRPCFGEQRTLRLLHNLEIASEHCVDPALQSAKDVAQRPVCDNVVGDQEHEAGLTGLGPKRPNRTCVGERQHDRGSTAQQVVDAFQLDVAHRRQRQPGWVPADRRYVTGAGHQHEGGWRRLRDCRNIPRRQKRRDAHVQALLQITLSPNGQQHVHTLHQSTGPRIWHRTPHDPDGSIQRRCTAFMRLML